MVELGAVEGLDDNELQAALLEYLDAVMAGQPAEAEDVARNRLHQAKGEIMVRFFSPLASLGDS